MEHKLGSTVLQNYLHMGAHIHVSLSFSNMIFSNFVPISLLVTLEIVHFFHALFMGYDVMMFDTD